MNVIARYDCVLFGGLADIAAVSEQRYENWRVGPGILNALLPMPGIPDDADYRPDRSDQVQAQFHDLVSANVKASNEQVEAQAGKHEDQHDQGDSGIFFMGAVILAAAVFVAVVGEHGQRLRKLK